MERIAKYRCLLPDMNLLSKNHELRLPELRKMDGSEDTRLRFIRGHKIPYALSCIYPSFVPKELYYLVSIDKVMNEDIKKYEGVYMDIDKDIYQYVPDYIQQDYPTYKEKKACGRSIYELIPKDRNVRCPVCNRAHERNNPYITSYDGRDIISCWQWYRNGRSYDRCSGPITIRHHDHNSPEKRRRLADILFEKVKKRYEPLKSKHIVNTPEIDLSSYTDGDIYVKSAMGTGKTKALVSILDGCDSYIMISNKIMQAKKYKGIFSDATLYGSQDWKSISINRLIVQMESLHHVRRKRYSILVLDEIESLFRIFLSDTLSDRELDTIDRFIDLINNCDRVIVMDAFLKENTVEWISSIRSEYTNTLIINEYKHVDRYGMKHIYVYDSKDQWVARVCDDKRRKVVVCLSKSIANSVAEKLTSKQENVLLITSNSDEWIKIADPHQLWCKFDSIVYTPTLSNSISFELEHFEALYVYGCRGSGGPEDLIQMMGRVRCIRDHDIHITCSNAWYRKRVHKDELDVSDTIPCDDYMPISIDAVYDDMKHSAELFHNMKYKPLLASIWRSVDIHTRSIFARVYADRGLAQRCFREMLLHILHNELGYTIHMNSTYERVEKLSKVVNTVDKDDVSIFHKYIDEKYDIDNKLYHNIWCKKNREIKNLSYMKRKDMNHKHVDKGVLLYNTLSELFKICDEDLDTCIENKRTDIKLVYNTDDSPDVKKYLTIFMETYGKSRVTQVWSNLHDFLVQHLFLKAKYIRTGNGGKGSKYTYHIDMSDWIWYYIK